ncbi:MAG: hypothetical protein N3G21_13640 [Candidatus Hydrogenedentes bacterium]|nr:hypothetical protein [Candidatus Hydrogenedentota bacterium]
MIRNIGGIETPENEINLSIDKNLSQSSIRVMLFGNGVESLIPICKKYSRIKLVTENPEFIITFGGDGTLISAELSYPCVPKVPILNSSRGHRCIPHPPEEVIRRLAEGRLIPYRYTKLQCTIYIGGNADPATTIEALNEVIVEKGRINTALRFKLWIDGISYEGNEREILGDGFMISTPFGSTAYFSNVTRGIFWRGIGVAFMATNEPVTHMILPEESVLEVKITRGPAVLAHDNSQEFVALNTGDIIVARKSPQDAIIYSYGILKHQSEPF